VGWLGRELQSDDERRHALAHEQGVPFVTLETDDISPRALELLPEPLCRAHSLAAYAVHHDSIEVALLDLGDLSALEPLRARLGKKILPRLATRESVRRALLLYQKILKQTLGDRLMSEKDPSLVLSLLLEHALAQHASEVELQTIPRGILVRYRHGKVLRDSAVLPAHKSLFDSIGQRAGFGSRTLPQDGRFAVESQDGRRVSVRVSSMPTIEGGRMLLRLVEEGSKGYTPEGVGMRRVQAESLRAALGEGLVLVASPEGGGRTTLLYTLLDMLNAPDRRLVSIESHISSRLPFVAQTQAPAHGLSMAAALRAALRQDPDVVMVDSIEDRETCMLALSAAARGTTVLAGIKAPDAAAGVASLQALGAADSDLGVVRAVVGTRRVKKLCQKQTRDARPAARTTLEPLEQSADFAKVLAALKDEGAIGRDVQWKEVGYSRVTGCSECQGGYMGHVGVFELITPAEPGLSLIEDALFKAAAGITSLEEVLALARG